MQRMNNTQHRGKRCTHRGSRENGHKRQEWVHTQGDHNHKREMVDLPKADRDPLRGHDQRGQVPTQIKKKKKKRTDFPGGPWLRLQAPNAGATGARVRPPVGETKIPRAKKGDPMAQKREKKRKEKGKHISWKQ